MSDDESLTTAESRVSEAWEGLLARDLSTYPNDLAALVEKASCNAKLRSMFPFLSIGRLCFSRCTDYPFAVPVWIAPAGNCTFSVQLPAASNWVDGKEIYRGSAEDAVQKADEALADQDIRVLLGNAETLGL
jgi:hypothetical protein